MIILKNPLRSYDLLRKASEDDATLFASCSLSLSQNNPIIIPSTPQKMPIENPEAILKLTIKFIGIVTLSGFGGSII
jgi:hypothetical protein